MFEEGDLKPCPFCGETRIINCEFTPFQVSCMVVCGFCGSKGQSCSNKSDAINSWNNRVDETARHIFTTLKKQVDLEADDLLVIAGKHPAQKKLGEK